MEPCANEVSGLLKGGIFSYSRVATLRLSAAFGKQLLLPGGFGAHTHHCSISHRSCETQVPPPPSPADHPDPSGKEQGCLGVSGCCAVTAPEQCPAEQRPFCVQALARAHQRSGRCSSFPHGHWEGHGGLKPTLALEAAQHPRCPAQEEQ